MFVNKAISLAIAACSMLPIAVHAQDTVYPKNNVRILVPFTAGTNADLVARLFAKKLSDKHEIPFVVENRPGAGGIVASQTLLSAAADGYTLMFVSSAHAANPSLKKNLPYNTRQDFTGIAMVGDSPVVLTVHPDTGVKTQADLITLAKNKASKNEYPLAYSSPGIGSAANFACELFSAEAGIEMQQIPFKGTEYVFELLSGRVQVACPPVGLAKSHVESGKLTALSVSSKERVALLPSIPTAIEAGLPGYEYGIWYGLVAPSKTPKAIVERLAADMSEIVNTKEVAEALVAQGITPRDIKGAKFDEFIEAQIAMLSRIAAARKITAD